MLGLRGPLVESQVERIIAAVHGLKLYFPLTQRFRTRDTPNNTSYSLPAVFSDSVNYASGNFWPTAFYVGGPPTGGAVSKDGDGSTTELFNSLSTDGTAANAVASLILPGAPLDVTKPCTVAAWVLTYDNSTLLAGGVNPTICQIASGGLRFGAPAATPGGLSANWNNGAGSVEATSTQIPNNKWTHVATTFDGSSTAKLYVNGDLITSTTTSALTAGNSNEIGGRNNAGAWTGPIGHVCFYQRVLSWIEVQQLHVAIIGEEPILLHPSIYGLGALAGDTLMGQIWM